MRTVSHTTRFKRGDWHEKAGGHGRSLDSLLMATVNLLAADAPFPRNRFDHALTGEWSDHRDCHIRPDLVLIYRKPARAIFSPSVSAHTASLAYDLWLFTLGPGRRRLP